MLSKKHVTDTDLDLDLDAICHGDFRGMPQGHLIFLESLITHRTDRKMSKNCYLIFQQFL